MKKFGIGQSIRRVEDQRLLTGEGCYTDDIRPQGAVFGAVVRSPHAHATILSIETDDAKELEGVLAVYTHAELDAAGIQDIPCMTMIPGKDGLIHISELAEGRVEKTEDVVKKGDTVTAKCVGVDDRGRVKMSIRAATRDAKQNEASSGSAEAEIEVEA